MTQNLYMIGGVSMKASPIVMNEFKYTYLDISVSIKFEDNLTFVSGESATGKSFLYTIFNIAQSVDDRIETFNFTSLKKDLMKILCGLKGKLIVIDNADILLDDDLRAHIAFDFANQYIVIGRNPRNLMLMKHQIFEMCFTNNVLSLRR